MVEIRTNNYRLIEARPFAPNLGAEIYGVDLTRDVPDDQFGEIQDSFHNYQIRFRWSLNDMAFWDNRCRMHRAIWDYWPAERKGRRVTIKGDRPS